MELLQQIPYFNQLPPDSQNLILRLLMLVLALVFIWILRRVVTAIIMKPLRFFISRTKMNMDDILFDAVQRPVRLLVLAAGIEAVVLIFTFGEDLENFAHGAAGALVVTAVMFLFYNLVNIVGITTENLQRVTGITIEERLLPFLRVVTKVMIIIIGLLIIVDQLGFNAAGLVASFGIVGLAFSLAAQDTASNVFGFTAIVSDNPFKVGDYIVTKDFAGHVEHVGVRSTRVRKLDQSLVIVPNSNLASAPITNWSRLEKRRLDFILGVTYSTSADQMRALLHRLREMLKSYESVDPDSVMVYFVSFGDSSLDVRIICYIHKADWGEWTAQTELINLEIMDITKELGIGIAFPSRSLYIESLPGAGAEEEPPDMLQEMARPLPPPEQEKGKAEESYQDNDTVSNS